MYRYISRESCSQFDSLPLTSLTICLHLHEARVLEVKCIEGLGTTVDAVILNGTLRVTDTLVLCGMHGAIVTPVRALLTPEPLKELRVKGEYRRHDVLEGAIGVKIAANDVDRVVAGTRLMVLEPEDDPDHIKEEVMQDLTNVEMLLSRDARGVFVQASTIGSLEALLGFLRSQTPPIPGEFRSYTVTFYANLAHNLTRTP